MTKKIDKPNLNNFNYNQKVNYIKNLLFNSELNESLNYILQFEKKDLELINIIIDSLKEKNIINKIKEQLYVKDDKNAKLYVYSRIISILSFYNKPVILNSLFKNINNDTLKAIAIYEYKNTTEVSISSKIFNKYCLKYKEEAKKSIKPSDEEILEFTTEIKTYNKYSKSANNKIPIIITMIISFFLLFIILLFSYKFYNKLKSYDNKVFKGIYLDNINLEHKSYNELNKIIKQKNSELKSGTLTIINTNGKYTYTYDQIGIKTNADNLYKDIKKYNSNLNLYKKIKSLIIGKKIKTFYITGNFSDNAIDNYIGILKNTLNTEVKDDGIVDDNHNISYSKGTNGFVLNDQQTKSEIQIKLKELKKNTVVNAIGDIIKNNTNNKYLASINKKIATFTTYFINSGSRGHNISLAVSKLNGTIVKPGETFSYLKTVGPYDSSNGYLVSSIYLNGTIATGEGGGVCQVATTTYVAQLYAGLQTVQRSNHSLEPGYVKNGLDATVYSTTVDYKFKNQYQYPIYISSYISGNYITVDIWSSDKTLGNKTYEPYSYYLNGGYVTYLKEFENGILVNEKYLSTSYYKQH